MRGIDIRIAPAALDGFSKSSFTSSSKQTHDVYRMGTGPAVIVIHEVPGLTPLVAAFGRMVAQCGMTAVLPDLFGTPGREPVGSYLVSSMLRACVSREFTLFATNKTSPIVQFLRELARNEHERCGGPGVGAIGMCLTGGFALAMSVDDTVVAPVLTQPSLPLALGARRRGAIDVAANDLRTIKRRADDGLCVMGLRFTLDKKSPGERFALLRRELGENFIAVEIDSSVDNPWGYRSSAHSVLTEDYVDDLGSPTRAALDDVLSFFSTRLNVTSPGDSSNESHD